MMEVIGNSREDDYTSVKVKAGQIILSHTQDNILLKKR